MNVQFGTWSESYVIVYNSGWGGCVFLQLCSEDDGEHGEADGSS